MNKLKYTLIAAAIMPVMAIAQANIWVWNNNQYTQYAGVDSVTYTVPNASSSQERPNVDRSQLQPEDKTFTVGDVSFVMKYVEGGRFRMGAQNVSHHAANYSSEAGSYESPVHFVTVSSFHIGQTEVTQALWVAVMGRSNGFDYSGSTSFSWSSSYGIGDQYPVYYLQWAKAVNFIDKLNQILHESGQLDESLNFCLPTEAQWEYAARGGTYQLPTLYAGSNNIDDVAWYSGDAGSKTHEVATKAPNELGLYDMSGNVYEWCADWYSANYYAESDGATDPTGPATGSNRVSRGGNFSNDATFCRVSYRNNNTPSVTSNNYGIFRNYGFRLCLK